MTVLSLKCQMDYQRWWYTSEKLQSKSVPISQGSMYNMEQKKYKSKGDMWLEGNGVLKVQGRNEWTQRLWEHAQDQHKLKRETIPASGREGRYS